MPDSKKKRGPADAARINVHETWEVDYWCKELGVTKEELEEAVKKAGVMVVDVKKLLKK